MLKYDLEFNNGILILRLLGILNKFNLQKLNKKLISIILENQIKFLIINLNDLNYFSLEGIKYLEKEIIAIDQNKGITCLCTKSKKIFNYFDNMNVFIVENENKAKRLLAV